jgi:sulfite exporter TauE/SafE
MNLDMALHVLLLSLLLGLAATASCLSICMPFFVPFVISHDNSALKGFITSVIFSVGRLIVYMTVGLVFFLIFSNLLENVENVTDIDEFSLFQVVVGWLIIIYGVTVLTKAPVPKICPAKYARGAVSLMVGMLIGSFICPPFILMLVANLEETVLVLVISVLLFWIGSSISIFLMGTGAGFVSKIAHRKFDPEKIRNIMHMVLIMVGIVLFLFPGYANLL